MVLSANTKAHTGLKNNLYKLIYVLKWNETVFSVMTELSNLIKKNTITTGMCHLTAEINMAVIKRFLPNKLKDT